MDRATAYLLYSIMIRIRLVEERIVAEYPQQQIQTPVHLCIGQEAVAAGISINLRPQDFIVSNHRSHGHCLARGLTWRPFSRSCTGGRAVSAEDAAARCIWETWDGALSGRLPSWLGAYRSA